VVVLARKLRARALSGIERRALANQEVLNGISGGGGASSEKKLKKKTTHEDAAIAFQSGGIERHILADQGVLNAEF
jgi:hypothetical protein